MTPQRPGRAPLRHLSAVPAVARLNRAALAASAVGVLVFLCLPVLIVVPMSFSDASSLRFPPEDFSLRWYAQVFGDPRWPQAMSTSLASREDGLESLIVSARDAAQNLDKTLTTTNGTIERLDQNLVRELPDILAKLESTLGKLDSAAGNADAIIGENRAAINSFANDGLGQLGPTPTQLRGLVRDLRRVSDRLEGNPARYLLGRDAPKEFDPK